MLMLLMKHFWESNELPNQISEDIGPGPQQQPPASSMSSGTELAWSQANRPPLCASTVRSPLPPPSAFIPIPGKVPVVSPMFPNISPSPVISVSSQFVGSPMPPVQHQNQVLPVQAPLPQQQQQVIFQQPQLLPSGQEQKYKVIQVVVPTRIAEQVINAQHKYQLIPAPPEAQNLPAFMAPPPRLPQQQVVQFQPQYHQLASTAIPPGAAIILPGPTAYQM